MKSKLPVRSSSRAIQRKHLRKYASGKVTIVNPEVNKKNNQTFSRQTPVTSKPLTPRRYGEAGPNNKTNDKLTSRFKTPKIRWQQSFKIQTGPTKLDLEAKENKELNEVKKTLQPGEVLARKVTLGYPKGFSVGGSITYKDDQGNTETAFMEYRAANGGIIPYLQEMQELGKPVILYFEEIGKSKLLAGVRPAEPITLQDTIPRKETIYSMTPAPTKKYPDRIAVSKGMFELDIESVRYFKNREELRKEEERLDAIGLNIFMEPNSPQTTINEFKKRNSPPPILLQTGWLNNPKLREFQILEDQLTNKITVKFTDNTDFFIEGLTKTFSKLKKAQDYVKKIEEEYK